MKILKLFFISEKKNSYLTQYIFIQQFHTIRLVFITFSSCGCCLSFGTYHSNTSTANFLFVLTLLQSFSMVLAVVEDSPSFGSGILLQSPQNSFWNGMRSRDMGTLSYKSIFVSGVGQGDVLAIGEGEGVGTTSFGAITSDVSFFFCLDSIG